MEASREHREPRDEDRSSTDFFSEEFDPRLAIDAALADLRARGRSAKWNPSSAGLPAVDALDSIEECRALLPSSDPNFRATRILATRPAGVKRPAAPTQDASSSEPPLKQRRVDDHVHEASAHVEVEDAGVAEVRAIDAERRERALEQRRRKQALLQSAPSTFDSILDKACSGGSSWLKAPHRPLPVDSGPTSLLLLAVRDGGMTNITRPSSSISQHNTTMTRVKIRVLLRGASDIRSVVVGTLCAFDKHFNLVLGSVREYAWEGGTSRSGGKLLREQAMIFLKGDNVVLVTLM